VKPSVEKAFYRWTRDLHLEPQISLLDFNIVYPKRATQVRVDLARNRATVQQVDRSVWSAFRRRKA
jgi:hypothetical protein